MPKLKNKLHLISELHEINEEIIHLKALANREIDSIFGLTGMVYTPHIDIYMQVCIKKSAILACLKRQEILPLSEVELISAALDNLHKRVKNKTVVEYEDHHYQRQFTPLKLTQSGKNVQRWARFWLLQLSNGKTDPHWKNQVQEIWPEYFLIRTIDL